MVHFLYRNGEIIAILANAKKLQAGFYGRSQCVRPGHRRSQVVSDPEAGPRREAAWDAIAFRQGHWYGSLPRVVDLAYKLEENTWNGNRRLQLVVEDLRPATRG